eukprot:5829440-Amphidinium_carterae.1
MRDGDSLSFAAPYSSDSGFSATPGGTGVQLQPFLTFVLAAVKTAVVPTTTRPPHTLPAAVPPPPFSTSATGVIPEPA